MIAETERDWAGEIIYTAWLHLPPPPPPDLLGLTVCSTDVVVVVVAAAAVAAAAAADYPHKSLRSCDLVHGKCRWLSVM